MNTYLFIWNSKRARWDSDSFKDDIEKIKENGKVEIQWACGNTKSMQKGDRAFLMKVGSEPKGIIAAGNITSACFSAKHWTGENRSGLSVKIELEILLNPYEEQILSIDILKTGILGRQSWTPQASCITIKPEIANELEKVWPEFLIEQKKNEFFFAPEEVNPQAIYLEGMPVQVVSNKYKRNRKAHKICLQHWGYSCAVCNFNFEQVYGEIGKNFIHVHHEVQISKVGKGHAIDPKRDLKPVCPNCHAMLHSKKEALSIDELRLLINNKEA